MAKNNVRIHKVEGLNVLPTTVWQTEANATAIKAGEPVKLKSAGSPYVIPLADNEPVIGTTTQMVGIAASDSDHTASADGNLEVYVPSDAITWECAATTSTNFDTVSEVNALVGDRILFDLISGVYTADENVGDAAVNGIQIVGGDPDRAMVYFKIRPAATEGPVA